MATLTIHHLDEALVRSLKSRAIRHGRSLAQEVEAILRDALQPEALTGQSLIDEIRAWIEPFGGIELELPERGPMREPPDFGWCLSMLADCSP